MIQCGLIGADSIAIVAVAPLVHNCLNEKRFLWGAISTLSNMKRRDNY